VTHRRWLCFSNPRLTHLLVDAIGGDFYKNPLALKKIVDKGLHKDTQFLAMLDRVKQANKTEFSNYVSKQFGVSIDDTSIYDFEVKRIHAYKRQLMNALKILDLYFAIKDSGGMDISPSTFIFAGKAAPGYAYAKLIIKLINSIVTLVNNDEKVNKIIKVLFLENYNVSMAQRIFPAADISEQISTASKEASGTSNMKFMMNGAITLGTMDGANIEIAQAVGMENIITFGLSVDEVLNLYKNHSYQSRELYNGNAKIKRVTDVLIDGTLKDAQQNEFMPIFSSLIDNNDEYFVLKDFEAYLNANKRANELYKNDKIKWLTMSAINIANSGRFSSDETIKQYASDIWDIKEIKF
jgi:starch phosphorylase